MEHLVDEDVEVHILHHPGDLADQAEDDEGEHEFGFLGVGGHGELLSAFCGIFLPRLHVL